MIYSKVNKYLRFEYIEPAERSRSAADIPGSRPVRPAASSFSVGVEQEFPLKGGHKRDFTWLGLQIWGIINTSDGRQPVTSCSTFTRLTPISLLPGGASVLQQQRNLIFQREAMRTPCRQGYSTQ